jgi:hypothetical protein
MFYNFYSPYLVKRSVDVFHSGRILPLVQGTGAFNSKTQTMLRPISNFSETATMATNFMLPLKKTKKSRQITFKNYNKKPFNLIDHFFVKSPLNSMQNFQSNADKSNRIKSIESKMDCTVETKIRETNLKQKLSQTSTLKQKIKSSNNPFTEMNVFKNNDEVRKLIPKSPLKLCENHPKLVSESFSSDFKSKHFQNLAILILKFLFNQKITCNDVRGLSAFENKLLMIYINKKKEDTNKITNLNNESLQELNKNWVKKIPNTNLQYVINNVINLMKQNFTQKFYETLTPMLKEKYFNLEEKARKEYCFYGYYFMDSRSHIPRKIEEYFHPKIKNISGVFNQDYIPKYVTLNYFRLLKKCDLFMEDFNFALAHFLKSEVQSNTLKWMEKECKILARKVRKVGEEGVISLMRKKYQTNVRSKFPWANQEVELAIKSIQKFSDKF